MSSATEHQAVSVERLDAITVLTTQAGVREGSASFDALVSDIVVATLETLKAEWSPDGGSVIVLQIDDGSVPQQYAEALFEALRGICGSLTLESPGAAARINLVRAASRSEAESTLRFLGADRANFVAGSTIDMKKGH